MGGNTVAMCALALNRLRYCPHTGEFRHQSGKLAGKLRHIGCFPTAELAHNAVLAAEENNLGGDFERGPLYPFCVIPVGDPTRFRVENLRTGERFGTHDGIVAATDEAQELATRRREGGN